MRIVFSGKSPRAGNVISANAETSPTARNMRIILSLYISSPLDLRTLRQKLLVDLNADTRRLQRPYVAVLVDRGERHAGELLCELIAAVIVRREWLFQPADLVFVHARHHGARVLYGVSRVRVGQDVDLIADRLAHGRDAGEIARRRIADAQFH